MPNTINVTYYAEHTDDPKSWASPKPDFDLDKFNRKLERRGGSVGSVPRFRCRWAGDKDEYILEVYDDLTGYTYLKDGKEQFVPCTDLDFEFPDGALVTPYFETNKVFIPRFVVEEYTEPFYHKAWMVENVESIGEQSGRIDVRSHYREPSEIDLKMAEHLSYLRTHLTPKQIADGIAAQNAREQAGKDTKNLEFIEQCAEDFVEAITDGIPNAPTHDFSRKFSDKYIKEYSDALTREHNQNL